MLRYLFISWFNSLISRAVFLTPSFLQSTSVVLLLNSTLLFRSHSLSLILFCWLRKWVDVRGSVHHSTIHKENPTRCNSVSKFYFIFIWSSTCFGRHTAHHQEPKTALASSGFAYVESYWMCSCWTLSASSNYTSSNSPRTQNQRMLVQF